MTVEKTVVKIKSTNRLFTVSCDVTGTVQIKVGNDVIMIFGIFLFISKGFAHLGIFKLFI